jgi:hypothetical protein
VDRVAAMDGVSREDWLFSVFETHFEIDQSYLDLVEDEVNRPDSEKGSHGIGVPDSILAEFGEALIVPLIALALEARKAGSV